MTRRLLLLLAATWIPSTGDFAQEPAKPHSDSIAGRDSAVLEVALKDLLSWPESPLRDPTKKQILFSPEALDDRLKLSDVLHRHDPREWDKLAPAQLGLATEAAGDLIRRLDGKEILKGLTLKDERIVVWDKKQAVAKRDRLRVRARPQVFRAFAPGYSRDRQIAVVRLTFPWSIHSGYATYVLARKESEWAVLIREFVYNL